MGDGRILGLLPGPRTDPEEIWRPEGWYERHPGYIREYQAHVDYYAQVDTSLTYQLL